jgi:hypothetical protein
MRAAFCILLIVALAPAPARRELSSQSRAAITLSTYVAGASASHLLSFDVNAGDLEVHTAAVQYPPEFRFRGFATQGPSGSSIGSYEIDLNADGVPEHAMPLRSLSATSAYVDMIPDGVFSSQLEPLLSADGGAGFELRLPFGGDASSETRVVPLGARVALRLNPTIIVNPELGGDYNVVARLTSVDPDSDGPDDGVGAAPATSRMVVAVHINGPTLTPFAKLRVEVAVKLRTEANRDRFFAAGRFFPGTASDGIDLRRDSVTVSFASFSQTIPASAFTRKAPISEYRGSGPGIHHLKIWSDGTFEVDVQGLHLVIPERRQAFELSVGNDVGQAFVIAPEKQATER